MAITYNNMKNNDKRKRNKYIIELDIEKNGLDIILKLKANSAIEKFFANLNSNEIETSTRWTDDENNGLKFYKKSTENVRVVARAHDQSLPCFDDFGQGLIDNGGRVNLAMLRIVGIGQGVKFKVTNLVSFEELKRAVEDLGKVAKFVYANYIVKTKIRARISYEL